MKYAQFSADDLTAMLDAIASETGQKNSGVWADSVLEGFARLVDKTPGAYITFGPYWWPVKQLLVDRGLMNLDPPDSDKLQEVSFGSDSLNIAAAFAAHNYCIDSMSTSSNTVSVLDMDSGDTVDYLLLDEEMEALKSTV